MMSYISDLFIALLIAVLAGFLAIPALRRLIRNIHLTRKGSITTGRYLSSTNVDRTPRNTNMLFWHQRLMLIDHGASLYFHHGTSDYQSRSRDPFKPIKEHVLLPVASALEEIDGAIKSSLTPATLEAVVQQIPEEWLDQADQRAAYLAYLQARLQASHLFVEEALHARAKLI